MILSIGFFATLIAFGSLDYATVFPIAPYVNETAIGILTLLIIVGAMAKSAQLPFHVWLADAIEGISSVIIFSN